MKNGILFNNYLLTRLTGTHLTSEFSLRGYDYKPEHFMILILLDLHGQMTQKAIGKVSIKGKSVISRAIDLLERRGVVKRYPSTVDGREKLVRLTYKGEKLYLELQTISEALEEEIINGMSKQDREHFLRLLKMGISNVGKKIE
jgi:DNA-binding MarR family transcriptional regulator